MFRRMTALGLAMLTLASCGTPSPIRVTGSSTIYPFTKAVADAFVEKDSKQLPPVVESVGTGSGVTAFCQEAAEKAPDVLDASRRMTRAEYDRCNNNKVGEILELRIGLDGIALAESRQGPKLALTSKDLYLALAASPRGKPNTARTWRDVNPALPAIPIVVLGPPKSSGTHDMFVSLIMRAGCLAAMPEAGDLLKSSDPSQFDATCLKLRADGPYVEEGENDTEIVAALEKNPNAVGLFGYSYLAQNAAKLRAVPIDGALPDAATIAAGKYVGYRTLYLYVRKARLQAMPNLKAFLRLYLEMAAPDGPLAGIGLIPLGAGARKNSTDTLDKEFPLNPLELS